MREWGVQRQCMRNARMTVLSLKLCQQDMKNNKYWFIFYIDEARHIVTLSWLPVWSACDETVSAYSQRGMKSFPRMLSMRRNHFRVCSACDEIVSPSAQHAFRCPCKNCQNFIAHWAYAKIRSAYAQHAMKSFPRMYSMPWNRFRVCLACANYNFRKWLKNL